MDGCQNINLHEITISAPGNSPNTDDIHIEFSTGVTVLNSRIATEDDCISIGPGSSNLWIQSITCGPGHGVSIGSLGWTAQEAGVQNVTLKMMTFKSTQNGDQYRGGVDLLDVTGVAGRAILVEIAGGVREFFYVAARKATSKLINLFSFSMRCWIIYPSLGSYPTAVMR
uniref:Polygalacturonase n=1 Tax=Lactuca sativa TaxID=4236 RepID=A0A9R1XU60_LACSA|nr:hypothetical protein LSAT_V11C100030810 [Lactuca sativa]